MAVALAVPVALVVPTATAVQAGQAQQQNGSAPDAPQSQSVPDAPSAVQGGQDQNQDQNTNDNSVKSLASQAARGKATPGEQIVPPAVAPPAPSGPSPDGPPQQEPPFVPKNAEEAKGFTIRVPVNYVSVPVTVLDRNHQQVAGLTFRDFRIYENGQRQHISFFSVDPVPLSVAFVIDQSLQKDTMNKVNESLSALQGAFTPSDEVAVFTYANGVTEQTTFTAALGNRLPAVLARSQTSGADMGVPSGGGPLAGSGPVINSKIVDPNLSRNTPASLELVIPRETHTLSDAILAAGKSLSNREKGRRRVIYVISDGKDARSKASVKEVIRYLQGNQEQVYATTVGDAATFGIGYLDRVHLPLIPAENVLPRYTTATGGVLEAEFSRDGIERSFARIMAEVRTQYTLGYYSHIPLLDSKFRQLDVHVERPNLDVVTKRGYYPTATSLQQP
ncbi:MAG: VWA domain-containing protein [Acidobacteriaceae bacterium]